MSAPREVFVDGIRFVPADIADAERQLRIRQTRPRAEGYLTIYVMEAGDGFNFQTENEQGGGMHSRHVGWSDAERVVAFLQGAMRAREGHRKYGWKTEDDE